MKRVAIVVLTTLFAVTCAVAQTRSATSAPAPTTALSTEPLDKLINELADPDPRLREEAGTALWGRGSAAAGALAEAAESPNPEIARRARAILRDFSFGLYPDAPGELFGLLNDYRKGDPQAKKIAVFSLGQRGVPGLRVLIKLREEERDAGTRQMISDVLSPREHDVSVLTLAAGQAADVERILETSAFDSPIAAQDYAALLLGNGKLPRKLAELKGAGITPRSAPVIIAMARAAGDGALARTAAEKSGHADLLDEILVEQSDWKKLSARLAADARDMTPATRLGYTCAYARLSGDVPAYDRAVHDLVDYGGRAAQEELRLCVENLFLNGRADDAIPLLLNHHEYLQATSFLAPRLQFREALELPDLADKQQPGEAIRVKAHTVGTLQFLGENEKAAQLMSAVAAENAIRNDFGTWVYLAESARLLGMTREMEQYAATALDKGTAQEPIGWLFQKMQFGDGSSARLWWQFLRSRSKQPTTVDLLRQLRSIVEGKLPADELEKLADEGRAYAAQLPLPDREAWQQNVIDTLKNAGRIETARSWVETFAETSASQDMLIYAGDFQAGQKNWSAAAADYQRAWDHDHTASVALFLHGWAVQQSGREDEGRTMMEAAHRLPLGNAAARHALLEAARAHGLSDDARREVDLILKATAPQSWDRSDALRIAAEDLVKQGHYAAAADDWERAFLPNLGNGASFVEPWANVLVPELIEKTRAMGLIQSGDIPAALKQAKAALDNAPGDADAVIDLVNALDKASRPKEAQAFFDEHTRLFRTLVSTYPRSGPCYNQLAWAEVMCGRDLDDALKNAKRSVELEPASTASIDTLAEVYFARHEVPEAIAQMKRCIELQPTVQRHRQQLARFEGRPGATTRPD